MKSKTSFFNTVIFLKNVLRFWPIWILYLLILIFQMPVNLFKQATILTNYGTTDYTMLNVLADVLQSGLSVLPICIFSLLSAAVVFAYLYNCKSCYTIHALPLKRGELFLTNYLSGILFLAVPQIIAFLLSVIVCIVKNITHVEHLFIWLLCVLGMTFFLYTLSVFCCMLSGHLGGVFGFFVIATFAFQCVRYFLNMIISSVCYGLYAYDQNSFFGSDTDSVISFLTPLYHLNKRVSVEYRYDSSKIIFHGQTDILIYVCIALVLFVICYILYNRRQMETVGDIVAVPWLVPVFRWAVALFGGLCLGTIITQILTNGEKYYFSVLLVTTVLFTFIFFYLAEMLLVKTFKSFYKKQIPQFLTCIAIMILLMCSLKADWFRIEEYVPKTEQIATVVITGSNSNGSDIITSDPETIEQITQLQTAIIEKKHEYRKYFYDSLSWKEYYSEETDSPVTYEKNESMDDRETTGQDTKNRETATTLRFDYYLKNGARVTRSYIIPVNKEVLADSSSPTYLFAKLQDDPDWYLEYSLCRNYKETSIRGGSIDLYDRNANTQTVNLSEEYAKKIWDAYQKDAKEGHLGLSLNDPLVTDNTRYYNSLNLYLYCANGFQDIYDLVPQQYYEQRGILQRTFSSTQMSSAYVTANSSSSTSSTTYTGTLMLNTNCTYTLAVIHELGITSADAQLITYSEYYHLMNLE